MKRVETLCWSAALAVLACAAGAAPARAQDCEVKLGVVASMTGSGAAWGLAMKGGTEFEAATANAAGGVPVGDRRCKVVVTTVDDMATAAGAAAASNFLAGQNIHLVVGPVSGPMNAGWKPVAKRNEQLYFTMTFAKDAIGPDYPLAFQAQLPPQAWAPSYLAQAKDRFPLKSLVVVGPNDQGGTDPGNALLQYYADSGVPGRTEWYQRGTMNFSPIATRLMSQGLDVVETGPMPPAEATTLVRQLREAGFEGVVGRSGAGADQIIRGLGGSSKVRNMFWWDTVPTDGPGIVRLRAEYQKTMGVPIPENSLVYCAQISAEQILRAITRAGTADDIGKVAAALRSAPPESRYLGQGGWRGQSMYGSNQQIAFPVGMGLIVNGKLQPQISVPVPSEEQ